MRVIDLRKSEALDLLFDEGQCEKCRYIAARHLAGDRWELIPQHIRDKASALIQDQTMPMFHEDPVRGRTKYHVSADAMREWKGGDDG